MEALIVPNTETYVLGLRLGDQEAEPEQFALWFSLPEDTNRVVTSGNQIVWAASEAEARVWGAAHLGDGSSVHPEAPSVCDVPRLLRACKDPDDIDSEFDVLATIDLLDDLRATADDITWPILDARRSLEVRKVHDTVRDALFDGRSWRESVEAAGGASAVADAALLMVGRICLASRLRAFAR